MTKKTLCAAIMLSMVLMGSAFAEDEEEAEKPFFYGKEGVSWTIKVTSGGASNQSEAKITNEVVALDEEANVAKVKMHSVSVVGGNEYKGPEHEITIPLTAASRGKGGNTTRDPGVEMKTREEKVIVPAGEFDCLVSTVTVSGRTSTTWMSKEHYGLLVKQVSETSGTIGTVELVALTIPE